MKSTFLLTGLLLGACGGSDSLDSVDDASPVAQRSSNAESFEIAIRHTPAKLPLNEEFEVRFELLDADGQPLEVPLEDIIVDADMPEHGHGMTVRPSLRREGSEYVAGPMLFHMGGRWEVYVDVRRGALTERAQVAWTLE